MRTFTAMMVGIAVLISAGCQTESWSGAGERVSQERIRSGQAEPRLIARTYASPAMVEEAILGLSTSFDPYSQIGHDRVYTLYSGDPSALGHVEITYIYVRSWETGSEVRVASTDVTPRFDANEASLRWVQIRDALDRRPAQSWLVYPADPLGEYASKKFGAPKAGSPELSMK